MLSRLWQKRYDSPLEFSSEAIGKRLRRARSRCRLLVERLEERCVPVVSLGTNFRGLAFPDSDGFVPPDTIAAVGPNAVIEIVNSAVAIYDKANGNRLDYSTLTSFFGDGFDPLVTYDEIAGRFIVAALERNGSAQTSTLHLAVSNDSTPDNFATDFTEKHSLDITQTVGGTRAWGDYPKIGYNFDAIFITLNMFHFNGGYQQTQIVTLDKSTYLDRNTATHTEYKSNRNSSNFTMCAAVMHGATVIDPMYFVAENSFGGGGAGGEIRITKMTNYLSANPTFATTAINVNNYAGGINPDAPQGGGIITTNDSRMLNAEWRNNRLVATHAVEISNETLVRWYEFNTAPATPTLVQQGNVDPGSAGSFTYFPSIAISADMDIGMTFMKSSASEFISMYATGRSALDALGTMQTPVLVKAGEAEYSDFSGGSFRAGDYSGISVDPTDDVTFWAANEYATSAASENWGTWIGAFRVLTFGTVGDFVWDDLDRDGVQDAGEPAIGGVPVRAFTSGGSLVASTTTNASGLFKFDLLPGNYFLEFTPIPGYGFTLKDQGSDNNLDSEVNPTTGRTDVFPVVVGVTDSGIDAGLVLNTGIVGDFVWNDLNRDGVQDAGEPGMAGVLVQAFTAGGVLANSSTTNGSGIYRIPNLAPGDYYLQFTSPAGFSFTLKDQGGDNNTDSDVNGATGRTDVFTVVVAVTDNSVDAGVVVNLPPNNVSPGGPYTTSEGSGVTLSGSANDPDGDTLTFNWDLNGDLVFGDATGASPTLTWSQLQALVPPINDGTVAGLGFNVRVQANDGQGHLVNSSATTLTVFNTGPTANLANNGPAPEGGTTTTVSFSGQSDPAAADVAAGFRYSYDFDNDGTFDLGGDTYATAVAASSAVVPSLFLPDGPGTRTVRARILDKDNGFVDRFTTITLTNANPTAALVNSGPVGEGSPSVLVNFLNQTDPSPVDVAAGFRYSYDFNNDGIYEVGDGLTYAGSVTQANATVPGPFPDGPSTLRVRARIIDKDGGGAQVTTDIVISNVAPTADLANNGPIAEGGSGAMVAFSNEADLSTADVNAGFRYSFDFNNDGIFEVGNGTYAGSGTAASASVPGSFLRDGPGVATIRARIIDKDGGSTDLFTGIALINVAPTVFAPGSNPTGLEGASTIFNLGSFTDPGLDTPWSVTVDWGDGQSEAFSQGAVGTLGTRSHSYVDNGTFQVQVTVNDGDGGMRSSLFNVAVDNVRPTVFAPGTQTAVERQPSVIDLGGFTDPGLNDALWNVKVNWADGSPVESFNVGAIGGLGTRVHQFPRDGTMNVKVTVTDADGGKRSKSFQVIVPNTDIIITGTDAGGPSLVRVYDSASNALVRQFNPFPDLPNFMGGVRVASADLNGDSVFDYIVGTGPGRNGLVRIFSGATLQILDTFSPYDAGFISQAQGVYVAVGDINFDGRKDIITGAGGLSQQVSVFSYGAGAFNPATRFLFDRFGAFPGFGSIDGVTVASVDVDGDGRDDIITGAGPGGPSRVRAYKYMGGAFTRSLIADFQAFENNYRRGVFVAGADVNANGRAEIIVGVGTTSGRVTQDGPNGGRGFAPRVRIFTASGGSYFFTEVVPFPPSVDTGVRVGAIEDGGQGKLLFATGHSVAGKVKKVDGRTLAEIDTVFSDPAFTRGSFVAGSR